MKIPLLITGANGLVGSKLVKDFSHYYQFDSLDVSDPSHPVDITKFAQVVSVFSESPAKAVVHFAAYTDVTGAWQQKDDTSGIAYQVNVVGTENIVKACQETGKHLIHISTAYVFNGDKPEPYTEDDPTAPIEWYGYTKAKAEEAVTSSTIDWTILRIDQPFRSDSFAKPDLIRKMAQNLMSLNPFPLFTDHYIGPTFIDDFVKVIDWVVKTGTTGLYHASSGEQWSDYTLGALLKEQFNLPGELKPGNLDNYLQTLDRPYQRNTALSVSKSQSKLDFKLLPIRDAVRRVDLGEIAKKAAVA